MMILNIWYLRKEKSSQVDFRKSKIFYKNGSVSMAISWLLFSYFSLAFTLKYLLYTYIEINLPKFRFIVIQLFWRICILAPIQQEAKHDQEKISAEQKWKVCWQSSAMFGLFTHQAKIKIDPAVWCHVRVFKFITW